MNQQTREFATRTEAAEWAETQCAATGREWAWWPTANGWTAGRAVGSR